MFNFLKKKQRVEIVPIDWSLIGIDFHSHLLPSVDDGVQSIAESVEIIRHFHQLGYKKLYISPHIAGEGFTNAKRDLLERFENFKNQDEIKDIPIQLGIIAEYYLDEKFENLLIKDELMTFNTRCILIETSMNYEFPYVKDYIFELIKKGYQPIFAHPERYNFINNEKDIHSAYEAYKDLGLQFQLNLFSLIGLYGERVKKTAEILIEQNLYDYVSSDIHKTSQIKYFEQLNKSIFLRQLLDSNKIKNSSIT